MIILAGADDRDLRHARIAQRLTYTLAQLISYATHDPKKMPSFDKVFPDGTPRPRQSDNDIFEAMQAWAIATQAA